MISAMRFVQIVGPMDTFDRAVDVIQDAGVLQIEEVPLAEGGGDELLHRGHLADEQLQQKQTYEDLVRLVEEEAIRHLPREALAALPHSQAFAEQCRRWEQAPYGEVAVAVRTLHADVRSFVRRRRNLEDDLRVLTAYEEIVTAFVPMLEDHALPGEHEVLGVVFEKKNRYALRLLEEHLTRLTAGECHFLHRNLRRGRVASLVGFDKPFAAKVREFIASAGISEIRGPRHLRDKPFDETIRTLKADLADLRQKRRELQKQMEEFSAGRGAELLALRCVCHDRFARLDAVSKFAQTRYAFVVEGWAPAGGIKNLRDRLVASCDPGVVVRKIEPHGAASSPPVRLKNRSPIGSFECLLALLPLPKYGTIDPTSFVATFFPPIFGLMLADVGYGLLLAIGALVLWRLGRTRPIAKALAVVLGFCSFFTIVFGFVFGELFGPFGHHIGLVPLWQERLELGGADRGKALLGYLVLAVAVGAAHVLCGLVLGIINAKRSGERGRVLDCAARIAGLFGLFFLVGRLAQFLPPVFTSIGVVSLLIFFVLMIRTTLHNRMHGLMLPLELLGTVGNILSYARIMAVGLASAVLALLASRFGTMIGNFVLAGVVVILIHALNLVLGVLDPTIQGLRLHYVEFFSKFYEAGGRPYLPFRKIGVQA